MYMCGYKSDVNLTFISDDSIGLGSKIVIGFTAAVFVLVILIVIILFKMQKGKGLHQII